MAFVDFPAHGRATVYAHIYALEGGDGGIHVKAGVASHRFAVHGERDVPSQLFARFGFQRYFFSAVGELAARYGADAPVVVVDVGELAVFHIKPVAAALVAVRQKSALVASFVIQAHRDAERAAVDEPARPPMLQRRVARIDGDRLGVVAVPFGMRHPAHPHAFVQRIHLIALGGFVPRFGKLAHFFGHGCCEVVGFGRVGAEIEQLPLFVVEMRGGIVQRHDLPAVAVNPSVPLTLVILLGVAGFRIRIGESVREARAHDGLDGLALTMGGHLGSDHLAQGRQHICDMQILTAEVGRRRLAAVVAASPAVRPIPGQIPRRPRHDHRHLMPAGVSVDLVKTEGRVANHRPAAWIVRQGLRAAHDVYAAVIVLQVLLAFVALTGRDQLKVVRPAVVLAFA